MRKKRMKINTQRSSKKARSPQSKSDWKVFSAIILSLSLTACFAIYQVNTKTQNKVKKAVSTQKTVKTSEAGIKVKDIKITNNGHTEYVILLGNDATVQEKFAADELSRFLKESTGATFSIVNSADIKKQRIIAVGHSASSLLIPNIRTGDLKEGGILIKTVGKNLILTGDKNATRGTIYAVYSFLEDVVGCRWWSPGESFIPKHKSFSTTALNIRYKPPFAYRSTDGKPALNEDWAVRNKLNGAKSNIDLKHGGSSDYVWSYGNTWLYVHTFYQIVPPKKYFAAHPEWFSKINGKRTHNRAQLCLTNKSLQEFMIKKVKDYLKHLPKDSIISISQNDWAGKCQCDKCRAIEKLEGSPSGPVIHFVNAIADGIKDEYPEAFISTLAYVYTQKPPKLVKPRPNVIIRLCTIKSSFLYPLNNPVNSEFDNDLKNWRKITTNLFIWDYVTNFLQYLTPFPDLRVIGPNLRLFAKNRVIGVFEQGDSQTFGGEFNELRTWLIAKLLWNPQLDDQDLIQKFTAGYYGAAAPFINKYINLLHDEAKATDVYLSCYTWPQNPYLNTRTLVEAEKLFTQAELVVAKKPILLKRVKRERLPVIYSILNRYSIMRQQVDFFQKEKNFKLKSFSWYLDQFKTLCEQNNVTALRESMRKPALFYKVMKARYKPTVKTPEICKGRPRTDWILAQDDVLIQFNPKTANVVPDPLASNALTVEMPSTHKDWSVQSHLPYYKDMNSDKNEKWQIYIAARIVSKGTKTGIAFKCGLYDVRTKKEIFSKSIPVNQTIGTGYRLYEIGESPLNPHRYVWVAPTKNSKNIEKILIDYIMYVRLRKNVVSHRRN